VAVDHFNTGHPHSHVIIRCKDETGEDLVIARDYMTRGLRTRAAEIVSLDLGRHTQHEITASVGREIEQERFTSMDRALMRFFAHPFSYHYFGDYVWTEPESNLWCNILI